LEEEKVTKPKQSRVTRDASLAKRKTKTETEAIPEAEMPKTVKPKAKKKTKPKPKDKREFLTMTEEEFRADGKRLFGDDQFKWKFQCPLCGNIQSAEDFRQYKDKGATTCSAFRECIGRYTEEPYCAFGKNPKAKKTSPCDYAAYGLFQIGNTVKMASGKEVTVFPFAERKKSIAPA